ncbi:MAG: hypothetical protein ACI8YQ_003940 [Polaribacter sp.]|jgi:hypothetical protein
MKMQSLDGFNAALHYAGGLKDSLLNETTDPAEINLLTNDKITLQLEREQANSNAQTIYKQLETDKLAATPTSNFEQSSDKHHCYL